MIRKVWILIIAGSALCAQASAASRVQPMEKGLEGRDDILFTETFETHDWFTRWWLTDIPNNTRVVRDETAPGPDKKVVEITWAKNNHFGAAWSKRIEPGLDEVYARWYVKFPEGFNFARGGKTPGLMGWAPGKVGGWGGRRVDGTNAFSCRICWDRDRSINMYTYHADQRSNFGYSFRTIENGHPVRWQPKRWYCMELHLRLNTPGAKPGERGKRDGLIELWMDDKLIGHVEGVRFRHVAELKIDRLFINAYFGGRRTSPRKQVILYDNFVVAKKKIGPIGGGKSKIRNSKSETNPKHE